MSSAMTHDRLNRAARASPFHWRSSGGASLRPAPLTTQACAAPAYASSRGSVAPCFLALALLSPRAVGRDEAECAVEGAPEGAGVAAGLGEDEAALDAGQGGGREPVRVGAGPEFAGGNHGLQASPDAGLPAVEPIRQDGADVVVAFDDLAKEAGDRAASLP